MKRMCSLTLLALSLPLSALDYKVVEGETVTDAIVLSNDGDRLTVEEGGAIEFPGGVVPTIAVELEGEEQEVRNLGRIATTGDATTAISIDNTAENARILNTGEITTVGDNATGIENGGENTTIENSGRIATEGEFASGISSDGDGLRIVNSGEITAEGEFSAAIFINASDTHIINSGKLRSAQDSALSLEGSNLELTLLRGSNIEGKVVFLGDPVDVNVETGLNLALILDPASDTTFGELGIHAPFVQVGDTLAVIDPTGLTLQADVLADLSDALLSGIYRHRFRCCNACTCGSWAQGIGSYRKRSEQDNHVGYDNWVGGFLVGFDAPIGSGNVNFFGGISYGEAHVDGQTQKAQLRNFVGGLSFERTFCDTFFGAALVGGYVEWDNSRFVMNNLVPDGVEEAFFNTHGALITPEITVSHRFSSFCFAPEASFTVRYAALFLKDYEEQGSATNLSITDRKIDLLTTRFEFALPFGDALGSACCWSLEPYVGVFGRYQLEGYRVIGELLDLPLHFDQEGPRNLVAFLVGFRGIQSMGQCNLFLNLEASFDNGESARILGEGGIGWSF